MGLFSFTQEIAMDLGTANTIITTNGKIVVDEPSVVALDRRTDKMIAVGDKDDARKDPRKHTNHPSVARWCDCRLLCLRADDTRTYQDGEQP